MMQNDHSSLKRKLKSNHEKEAILLEKLMDKESSLILL